MPRFFRKLLSSTLNYTLSLLKALIPVALIFIPVSILLSIIKAKKLSRPVSGGIGAVTGIIYVLGVPTYILIRQRIHLLGRNTPQTREPESKTETIQSQSSLLIGRLGVLSWMGNRRSSSHPEDGLRMERTPNHSTM